MFISLDHRQRLGVTICNTQNEQASIIAIMQCYNIDNGAHFSLHDNFPGPRCHGH